MHYSIDIETENEGIDVFNGVKRVLSVQIGDDAKQELYHVDSKLSTDSLILVKDRIRSLLDEGHSFVGYNIKNFDIPKLKQFLEVDIPQSSIVDIIEMKGVTMLKEKLGRKSLRLEQVCEAYGIDASHKNMMNEYSQKFQTREITAEARLYAKQLTSEKGWSEEFAYRYSVESLAKKEAITESYREFVKLDGSKNTLFYRYAVGDIISEHQLFKALIR